MDCDGAARTRLHVAGDEVGAADQAPFQQDTPVIFK
jgi:hypothetical protein